jgi:hypothetical protein
MKPDKRTSEPARQRAQQEGSRAEVYLPEVVRNHGRGTLLPDDEVAHIPLSYLSRAQLLVLSPIEISKELCGLVCVPKEKVGFDIVIPIRP